MGCSQTKETVIEFEYPQWQDDNPDNVKNVKFQAVIFYKNKLFEDITKIKLTIWDFEIYFDMCNGNFIENKLQHLILK